MERSRKPTSPTPLNGADAPSRMNNGEITVVQAKVRAQRKRYFEILLNDVDKNY